MEIVTGVRGAACDKCSYPYYFTTKTDTGYSYLCFVHYFEDD